jgi:hypothetical protein
MNIIKKIKEFFAIPNRWEGMNTERERLRQAAKENRNKVDAQRIDKMYVLPTGYKYTSQGSAQVIDVPPDHTVVLLCENILTAEQRASIMHHWTIAMNSKGAIPFIAHNGIEVVIIRKQAP